VRGALLEKVIDKDELIQTKSTFDECERTAHTYNLRAMMLLGNTHSLAHTNWLARKLSRASYLDYPRRLMIAYTTVMQSCHQKDPAALLSLLLTKKKCYSGSGSARTPSAAYLYTDVLKLHITICNAVCSKFAVVQFGKRREVLSNKFDLNDSVAIIMGVPEALIMRPCADSMQIIGRFSDISHDRYSSYLLDFDMFDEHDEYMRFAFRENVIKKSDVLRWKDIVIS
jgi:hypothetical protein